MPEKQSELFFELSHEDRLKILHMVQNTPMKLTHLSEKLNLKVQEISRHVSRLSDAKLILKEVEGFYHLTPYGDHVIRLLPSFEFLSKHRNYFTTHKSSHLPEELVSRIGELNKCMFTDDIMVAFQEAKTLFEEAKNHVWLLADHMVPSTPPSVESAMKRGVKVRSLLLESLVFPPGFQPMPFVPGRMEGRTLERVDVDLFLSEKKGLIAFPTIDGKIDHTGFISKDEISNKWLEDLFNYYWERAKAGTPKGYQENQ